MPYDAFPPGRLAIFAEAIAQSTSATLTPQTLLSEIPFVNSGHRPAKLLPSSEDGGSNSLTERMTDHRYVPVIRSTRILGTLLSSPAALAVQVLPSRLIKSRFFSCPTSVELEPDPGENSGVALLPLLLADLTVDLPNYCHDS